MTTAAPEARSTRRAVSVWAAAVAVYLLAVFHRSSLSVAGLIAADRFDISASQLSTFTMIQLLVYASMQIPVGLMLDRFGPRRMLLVGLSVLTLAQLGFAFAGTYQAGIIARVFVGMGDAMIFISVLRLVSTWFAPLRIPVVTQVTGLVGQLGAVAAAVPMTMAFQRFGWTDTYLVTAGLGVVLGAWLYLIVRDTPEQRVVRGPSISARAVVDGLRSSWRQPGTRLAFWTHFSLQYGATTLALLWGFPFFVRGQGVSETTAGLLLTLLTVATMISGPIVGVLVGRRPFHRSTLVLVILASLVAAWTAVLAWPGPAPLWLLVLLVCAVGVGGPGSMVAFDFARTFNPPERLGSATGIVNQGGFIASLLSILGIGLVLDVLTPGTSSNYSASSFTWAMCVQYVLWTIGATQIVRYRRKARTDLAERDPQAYEQLRSGGRVLAPQH
ncbi:MFS transporter [Solicola gregarius]|uniref:Lysosomal dipeptide transporter MFSD1 n=1 Tax=Solicola gregarius TaxID=2908642 RepID=A0AA46YNZ0_9ACTN|nr:MFS transporter [Solicola gregarius]UYM07123.1 MFS transporter [Solicola gregarius]